VNARSNSESASGTHYALYVTATLGTLTCDYNDYFVSGTGGKPGYYGSEKTELPIVSGVTGNDVQSKNADPSFASPGGTLPANYLSSLNTLVAATGTGITTDYDGGADRSLTYPAMGAFEYTVSACSNPTGGGTIAADQTICSGIVPAAFTSIADPSGHTGTLEYKWQLSTTSSSSGFNDIASSNSETFTPGTLTATTWYTRLAGVSCMADWTGATASNVIQITVNPVPTIAAAGSDQTVCASSATLAGNTATAGTGTWTKTSGTATISDPSGPTSGLTGISGTAVLRWTIATAGCGSSFDEVSITSSLPANQTVTATSPICTGSSSAITLGSSQSGVYYALRDNSNNAVIAGPTAGTGAALNFSTGALTTDKAYNVLATVSKGALAFTGNPGLKKVSLGTTLWTNNFQGTNKATVEAWVYRTATGSLHTIIGNYEGSYPFLLRIDGDRITLFVNSSSMATGATTLAINTWYHLAGTYDGTNLKVYVNGVLDGTTACSGNFISTTSELKIGGGLSNNTEYFPGSISDVRLWSVARTAAEISAGYNLALSGNESGLVALYTMGEGAGSTLGNSATGNLYPGTLVNSPAWVAGPPNASACTIQMTDVPAVTVTPNNTAGAASSSPTLCVNSTLTDITHTTTGATGIGSATGLPAGVTAAFASNTITISGTPTASGTFNYSIPLTGGCGSFTATGTIIVDPATVGGTISGGTSVCTGTNSTTLTLSGYTGSVTQWQSSTDNWTTPVDIDNTTATLTATNLTASTKYRAVLSSGTCSAANSTDAEILIISIANQTVTATSPICTGSSSTITLGSSQSGVNYTLRDNSNNAVIAGPTAGTGAALNFSTGALTTDKTYNVIAEKSYSTNSGALDFDGGNDYVSCGNAPNLQISTGTIEAWIKTSNAGSSYRGIITKAFAYSLYLYDNVLIAYNWASNSSLSTGVMLNDGNWHHVAFSFQNGVVNGSKIYIDGIVKGTYSWSVSNQGTEIAIGNTSIHGQYFTGNIDEIRIWNTARTPSEITANMNNSLVGNEFGLVAYYTFENGSGTTLTDMAGGDNNGALTNMDPATDWITRVETTTCTSQMASTPMVTVTPNNTAGAASSSPTLCVNSTLTDITHSTTGATGIGSATGLPAGVTAAFASNTLTITGTPTASGTFNYSIPLTGGCGNVNATGTIAVNPPSFVPAVRHVSDLAATGENIKWYAAASGGTALAGTDVLPTGTTHYYASQTVNGVESTARLDVTATIDPTPCAPTGSATQSYTTGATVASLQATGSGIRWYAAASGGTALASSTLLVNGTHYWATQTVNCTESASRLDITTIVN
jgi:hypothetical protein